MDEASDYESDGAMQHMGMIVHYTANRCASPQLFGEAFGEALPDSDEQEPKEIKKMSKKDQWEYSDARKLLLEALMNGEVSLESTTTSKPRHVYAEFVVGKEEFQRSDFADKVKFGTHLHSLRKIVKTKQGKAAEDAEILANTRKKHPKETLNVRGKPQFKGSPAEKLLKEAIDQNLHTQKKPKELWLSRPEFHEVYELEEFRKRIHQEVYDRKAPIGGGVKKDV